MTSILKVDQIQNAAGGVPTAADLGLNVTGSVLQVKNLTYTDTFSQSITSGALNNLQLAITPTSPTSKILIQAQVFFEFSAADHDAIWYLQRDSASFLAPDAGSRKAGLVMAGTGYHADDNASTPSTVHINYFDEPATTSEVTYKVAVNAGTARTFYINRTVFDTDNSGYERGVSSITLMEIAG